MKNTDNLIGNMSNDNSKYCFSNPGKVYVIYMPKGGSTDLDLCSNKGSYHITWYSPIQGGVLQKGSITEANGQGKI